MKMKLFCGHHFSLLLSIFTFVIISLTVTSHAHAFSTADPATITNDLVPTSSIVQRIEPPFWWVGMQQAELQILLYGKNIAEFSIETDETDWKVNSLQKTSNPNYLFVNLTVAKNARAGLLQLQLIKDNKIVQFIPYQLNLRETGSSARQGFNSSDAIYLITPDRFANGDYTNDKVSTLSEGITRNNLDGRHGGDLQGIIDHLDYIGKLGFTQIWINPVLQNDHPHNSYHGYSTTDYYQVDARMGSNQLLQKLAAEARKKNIGIIKDVILNHIGTEHWWMKDLPAADWINNNATFTPTSHRRESLHDPHGTAEDREAFASGWFVPTMADLNQRNPLLANYLIQNNIWWIEYANLSGIRLDTYSYADKNFLSQYTARIMQEYPNFNLVAEEWTTNPNIVAYWQRGKIRHDDYQSQLPSLMDFPLQQGIVKGLLEKESWSEGLRKLYEVLASDFVYSDPDNLVIFADNHDMSRIYTQLNHDQALTQLAMVLLATTRGIPQVYYGTELLMENRQNDSHGLIRSDFPGGWKADKINGFSSKGLTNSEKQMQTFVSRLFNWRKLHPEVHYGELTHYAPVDGVYVYFRHNANAKVMIIVNKNEQSMEINTGLFPSMLGSSERQKTVIDVLTAKSYSLADKIKVESKRALIFEIR